MKEIHRKRTENNFEENSYGNNDKKKTFDKNKLIDKHRKQKKDIIKMNRKKREIFGSPLLSLKKTYHFSQ